MNPAFLLAVAAGFAAPAPACPSGRDAELVSHAEASLGRGLPVYLSCVYGRPDDNSTVWLFFVRVYEKSTGRDLGDLSYPDRNEGLGLFSLSEVGGSAPRPKFVDLDFDGHLDVSLLAFVGATGNSGSNIWLFRPDENKFVYDDVLSAAGNLRADPDRKELTSRWNGGHAGAIYGKAVYRWIDGQATKVRDESQHWDSDRNCYDFRLLEWRYGKLVETVRRCLATPP